MTSTTDKIKSLQHDLDRFKTNYETEQAKFLESVQLNPANAIGWADRMVEAQGCYEHSLNLAKDLETAMGNNAIDAVREAVKDLNRIIRRSHGTSTSGYSNAVEYSKHMAAVRVLEMLEGWLEYATKEA